MRLFFHSLKDTGCMGAHKIYEKIKGDETFTLMKGSRTAFHGGEKIRVPIFILHYYSEYARLDVEIDALHDKIKGINYNTEKGKSAICNAIFSLAMASPSVISKLLKKSFEEGVYSGKQQLKQEFKKLMSI